MKHKKLNVLGSMSGTSLDGVDISIINTDGIEIFTNVNNYYFEYPKKFREIITKNINFLKINKDKTLTNRLSKILSNYFLKKILTIPELDLVDLIGYHGQTIYHDPKNFCTFQIGNPQYLSDCTNKIVVSDFRTNDMIHGGQGAPIAPIFHRFIIKKLNLNLPSCFINIGGVANLTYFDNNKLIGFDTGPGNCLIDLIVNKIYNRKFDDEGKLSSKGTINKKFLNTILADDYFYKSYPKSLDNIYFNHFLHEDKIKNINGKDLLATLCELTALSISNSISKLPKKPNSIVFSGGGVNNLFLMSRLRKKIKVQNVNIKKKGFDPNFIESQLIAYLSARSFNNLPITFPDTTGVRKPMCGGKLFTPKEIH